jgi:hypothetical protein
MEHSNLLGPFMRYEQNEELGILTRQSIYLMPMFKTRPLCFVFPEYVLQAAENPTTCLLLNVIKTLAYWLILSSNFMGPVI